MSYDLPDLFYTVLHDLDVKKGFKIIELCVDNFPKDPDGIVIVILESMYDNCNNIKYKLILEVLMNYYLELVRKPVQSD